jgi:hypothetical protein
MQAKLSEIKEELRRRMHQAIPERGRWLAQVIRGYFAYHAVPTNFPAPGALRHHVKRLWLHTLRRRSQKDRLSWERILPLCRLPPFDAGYCGERRRSIPLADSCLDSPEATALKSYCA